MLINEKEKQTKKKLHNINKNNKDNKNNENNKNKKNNNHNKTFLKKKQKKVNNYCVFLHSKFLFSLAYLFLQKKLNIN